MLEKISRNVLMWTEPQRGEEPTVRGEGSRLLMPILALVLPCVYVLLIGPRLSASSIGPVYSTLIGIAVMWLITGGIAFWVVRVEKRSLTSVGLKRLSPMMALQSFGIGVLLVLSVPLLQILARSVIPSGEAGSAEALAARSPWWLLLLSVVTAGVTEEFLYRGYPLERLLEWNGSKWVSSLIALAFFALAHAGGWNLAHIVGVVIPLGAALTALYWWRRNLVFVMIAHTVVDLPIVFLALATQGG